jgi:hypothetical protein
VGRPPSSSQSLIVRKFLEFGLRYDEARFSAIQTHNKVREHQYRPFVCIFNLWEVNRDL